MVRLFSLRKCRVPSLPSLPLPPLFCLSNGLLDRPLSEYAIPIVLPDALRTSAYEFLLSLIGSSTCAMLALRPGSEGSRGTRPGLGDLSRTYAHSR